MKAVLYLDGERVGDVDSYEVAKLIGPPSPIREVGVPHPSRMAIEWSLLVPNDSNEYRSIRAFTRLVARLSTPFAPSRGLKKPRGRRAKAREAAKWTRLIASRRAQKPAYWRDAAERLKADWSSRGLIA